MENFSPATEEMLKAHVWHPEPDWDYYCQGLATLNLTLHASVEQFLNTYDGLELSYITPLTQEQYASLHPEELTEDYSTSFYFTTDSIQSCIGSEVSAFPLLEYNRKTRQLFLPIAEASGQFGQVPWDALVLMNALGKIHFLPSAMDEMHYEFESGADFFAAIATEYVLEKPYFA
jgi:hypothetical protein